MNNRFIGKPSPLRLQKLLEGAFGKERSNLLVGPGVGLDAAVLDLGNGRVMAIAEDPVFPAPKLPLEMMGQLTVHIGASDVAVTGIRPEFMTYSLLLPPTLSEEDARTLIQSISKAAVELEITIVGGHTGWYDAVVIPIVGGVTVWGFAADDAWISPGGARDGDVILMTKGPAIEAAALLGVLYRERLEQQTSQATMERIRGRIDEITVVRDALIASSVGGVHAMHDATEGGVLGGLWEMHAASGLALHVDLDQSMVPEDIAILSHALGFDPWRAISEGTLLAAVAPNQVEPVRNAWNREGITSYELGRFDSSLWGPTISRGGETQDLPEPTHDPFWSLFFAGLENR